MAPYLNSMMNGTSSRVSVRPAQGIGKASPMSKSSSSLKKLPKTSKDGKGTVSNNVSKQSKPKKAGSPKSVDFVVPTFDRIKGVNCCVNCKKGNHLTDSIVCQLCNTSFHALCKTMSSSNVDDTAICTPTFLTSVRPVIAKYGANAKRWGNFLFVCVNCNDELKTFMNSKKEERVTVDCGVSTDPELNEAPKTSGSILLSDDEDRPDKNEELITEVIDQVQIILKGFENGFLSRVDTMLDDKLSSMSSHNLNTMSMRRTPTHSSSSGVWSSASVSSFEPEILSEQSPSAQLLTPSFSNVLQMTTPLRADMQSSVKESMDARAKSATDREIELIKDKCSDNENGSLNSNSSTRHTADDSQHIIVLRMDKSKSANLNETKQSVSKILKSVPVINMKENIRDKKVVIQLPSVENKQLAKELLLKSPMVKTSNIIVDDTKKMLPKITVANIPNYIFSDIDPKSNTNNVNSQSDRELMKSILKQAFMDKNEEVRKLVEEENKTFDIVFVKTGYTYTTAGIKVSPIIRKLLLDQGFVYIADTRSKVTDRLDLKQCFNCQRLGHISTDCHDRGVTCMYCSASHRTGACPEKLNRDKHRCVNCSHSEEESLKSNCHTHHSGEETCPIIMEALDKVRCNTEYSKNI